MFSHRFLALALAALALSPAPALAASATQTGYDDPAETVVTPEETEAATQPAAAAPTATSAASLPFTGVEAGLIAAAGLALAGTGFSLRRAARQPQ